MGFEPQTSRQPLVNLRKRTTKVNLVIAASVVIFLSIGIFWAVRVSHQAANGEPLGPPATPGK